jgi:hypothetical protein
MSAKEKVDFKWKMVEIDEAGAYKRVIPAT